jgi:hypothetical protein
MMCKEGAIPDVVEGRSSPPCSRRKELPSYLGEGRSCSLRCKEKEQLTILQKEGAAPYFSDGRSSSLMPQKEGASDGDGWN